VFAAAADGSKARLNSVRAQASLLHTLTKQGYCSQLGRTMADPPSGRDNEDQEEGPHLEGED